jgi:hypothetical protein
VPNCENLVLVGKGGASVFCPLKSSWIPAVAESRRKLCRAGRRDIQHQTRGLTPASDVTDRAKVKNNMGAAAAAGVVTGAWQESAR